LRNIEEIISKIDKLMEYFRNEVKLVLQTTIEDVHLRNRVYYYLSDKITTLHYHLRGLVRMSY